MTPRYEWTPASEPPEDARSVIVWTTAENWFEGFYRQGQWYAAGSIRNVYAQCWRDVEPPNSSATLTGSTREGE